ncbi:hypothetical protein [Bacillus cereus]|uniref:hypothetical protein n=1 Tax=Bacillus cereus TaxID=1396 RepID=UPI002AC134CF|nr:hypothetical protein [Bacillus cereus]MDZ4422070.1 hypothetical protein [Bacillus cereus]
MEHIREYVQKANSFGEYYKANVYTHLKKVTNEIISEFKRIFEQNARESGLVISNSVYEDIHLFDFTDRVKDPVSLTEKLKNKNLIFELEEFFNVESLSEEKKLSLNDFFYKIDDIIGIKILTSLNYDCQYVLNLITKEMSEEINGVQLVLDGEIPTTMSNGRKIYKLKGCFRDKYAFELQIKSKIDSAWGDLEHNLFYKDYDFNYIKNNNKEIMVNIGSVLEKTEDLMLSIREGKKEFSNAYEKYNFYQAISDEFEQFVQENYGSKYILEKNMDKLYGLYNCCFGEYSVNRKVKVEDIKIPESRVLENALSNNFKHLKLKNFEISLIETIHFNWLNIKEQEGLQEIERIEGLIRGLLYDSLNKIASLLQMKLLSEQYVDSIINILTVYQFDYFQKNILLNTELLAQFVLINIAIDQVSNNAQDEEFGEFEDLDNENFEEFLEKLKLVVFKHLFIEKINENQDTDSKIFISAMIKVLNEHNASNKKNNEVTQETIHLLNTILGGRYGEI